MKKIKNIVLSTIIVIIMFYSGYYLAYSKLENDIELNKKMNNVILSGFDKMNASNNKRKTIYKHERLIRDLLINEGILNSLVYIEKSGKPIDIAIRDSNESLEKVIKQLDILTKNIDNKDEKEYIKKEIEKVRALMSESKFYYE